MALFVSTDANGATRHVLSIGQAALGLPDRDDHAKTDATTLRVKGAYRQHAASMLTAAGTAVTDTQVSAAVDALTAFEGELAAAAMTLVQRRGPNAVYNPVTLPCMQTQAPGLDWRAFLGSYTGLADIADSATPIVLSQPAFAAAVAHMAQMNPLDTWRDYLRVRLLATATSVPTTPATTAPSAWSSATRSRTTSTTAGASSTPPAACATGGSRATRPPTARADRVAALYGNYEPLPGERINGRQTLGENLSDVGGLQIALERQNKAGKPAPRVDGHTPEQRFFIAKCRDLAHQVPCRSVGQPDPHGPAFTRALEHPGADEQHAGLRAGLQLQTRRQHGRRRPHRRLVSAAARG